MIFARKIIKIPEFFMIIAGKMIKIPEFYMIFARKMPEFYIIITRKIFFPEFFFFGGGDGTYPAPCPRPSTPIVDASWILIVNIEQGILIVVIEAMKKY